MAFWKLADGKYYGRFQHLGARKGSLLCLYTPDKAEPRNQKAAQIAYETFCGAVRSGKAFIVDAPERTMTVAEFVEYYKEHFWNQREKHTDGDDAILNGIARYYDTAPLQTWNSPHAFTKFHTWLSTTPIDVVIRKKVNGVWTKERKATTRLRSAKTLGDYRMRLVHMVGYAKAYELLDKNPFENKHLALFGKAYSPDEGRHRGVTLDEEKALYAACDKLPEQGVAMDERLQIALTLGMRRGEMQRTQLRDIDFDEWLWTFPGSKDVNGKTVRNTKNGKTRTIPVPKALHAVLKSKRNLFAPDAFLFGAEGTYVANFKKAWAQLKKHAKLDDGILTKKGRMTLHWHDLRGEAGTRMLDLGVAPATVADMLGNTVEVLLKHYKGDLLKSMRKAADLIGAER